MKKGKKGIYCLEIGEWFDSLKQKKPPWSTVLTLLPRFTFRCLLYPPRHRDRGRTPLLPAQVDAKQAKGLPNPLPCVSRESWLHLSEEGEWAFFDY